MKFAWKDIDELSTFIHNATSLPIYRDRTTKNTESTYILIEHVDAQVIFNDKSRNYTRTCQVTLVTTDTNNLRLIDDLMFGEFRATTSGSYLDETLTYLVAYSFRVFYGQ